MEDRISIIETLLNNEMKYGNLPKALIKFHQYEVGNLTPIDEHIYEGENYLDAEEVNYTLLSQKKTKSYLTIMSRQL